MHAPRSLSSFPAWDRAAQHRWAADWERRACLHEGYVPVCSHRGYTPEEQRACVDAQIAEIEAQS